MPQHMLWGLVDVPQGEFAEQLVPTGQTEGYGGTVYTKDQTCGLHHDCKLQTPEVLLGGCSAFSLSVWTLKSSPTTGHGSL